MYGESVLFVQTSTTTTSITTKTMTSTGMMNIMTSTGMMNIMIIATAITRARPPASRSATAPKQEGSQLFDQQEPVSDLGSLHSFWAADLLNATREQRDIRPLSLYPPFYLLHMVTGSLAWVTACHFSRAIYPATLIPTVVTDLYQAHPSKSLASGALDRLCNTHHQATQISGLMHLTRTSWTLRQSRRHGGGMRARCAGSSSAAW